MDREAQGSSITVYHKRPKRDLVTVGDYRKSLVQSLMYRMLNARFGEIARQPNAPFVAASSGDDTLGRTLEAFVVSARVQDGTSTRGLNALGQELARVRQHGAPLDALGEIALVGHADELVLGAERTDDLGRGRQERNHPERHGASPSLAPLAGASSALAC